MFPSGRHPHARQDSVTRKPVSRFLWAGVAWAQLAWFIPGRAFNQGKHHPQIVEPLS
jgi:hypothetical protein